MLNCVFLTPFEQSEWYDLSKILRETNLQRLLLDDLLEIDVGLVGDIKRKLKLGDLDLQLLLDAGDLRLQLGLSLNHTSVQLLDLDAGLLAVDNTKPVQTLN